MLQVHLSQVSQFECNLISRMNYSQRITSGSISACCACVHLNRAASKHENYVLMIFYQLCSILCSDGMVHARDDYYLSIIDHACGPHERRYISEPRA